MPQARTTRKRPVRSSATKAPRRSSLAGTGMPNGDLVKSQVDDLALVTQRRGQFVKAAIELFSRKGYHATTVKEIADASGVSPGLIYQYVTDKDDILFLALQLIVQSHRRVIPVATDDAKHPIQKFIAAFEAYCRVFDENRHAAMLTYRESKSLNLEHRNAIKQMELETNQLIAETIRACIAEGWFRKVNVELFVYQVIMIAHTWALKYWRLHTLVSLDEYVEANVDLLMNAVLTRDGWSAYLDYVRSREEGSKSSKPAKRAHR
jgi:AcrR family transcriptional regulator